MTDLVEMIARAIAPDTYDMNEDWRNAMRSKARSALAALEAGGMTIVPREATKDMINAGASAVCMYIPERDSCADTAMDAYQVMIAAFAPHTSQEETDHGK